MFKLLRLAVYGIVGYALYAFVTDVINASREEQQSASRGGRGNRARAQAKPVRMTGTKRGGGTGKAVETHDADGATTRHRVGRGVV
jgi:hypothetical protein